MERFYKMIEASNKHFPRGVEPYQMVTRLLEESIQASLQRSKEAGYIE